MNLISNIPEDDHDRPRHCLECKAQAVYWKWSLMGGIRIGLCEEHKDWTMSMTFSRGDAIDRLVPPRRKR